MEKKTFFRFLAVEGIVGWWLLYLWQEQLANIGDYRWFSYSFYEVCSFGVVLVPLLSLMWLVVLAARCIREKSWRREILMVAVLVLLVAGQAVLVAGRTGMTSVDSHNVQVVEVPDEYHIVIRQGERHITLETNPQVTGLVRQDGTQYSVQYTCSRFDDQKGTLNWIRDMELPERD